MLQSYFTNAITCAAATFLVAGILVFIPLVFVFVILIIFSILWLFLSTISWLSATITVTTSIAAILFCLPFIAGLIAGITGFIWRIFNYS